MPEHIVFVRIKLQQPSQIASNQEGSVCIQFWSSNQKKKKSFF